MDGCGSRREAATDGLHDTDSAQRKIRGAVDIFLLCHREVLQKKYGVDGINGRIHPLIDRQDIRGSSPETIRDYERLRGYVKNVLQNDPEMQDILAACERKHRKMIRAGNHSRLNWKRSGSITSTFREVPDSRERTAREEAAMWRRILPPGPGGLHM